eukprot:gnl/TRDRNA2_/TRDRNA2_118116_c0_seq1.p1 gnl/TRDRNA2_/TRDRNA2_118116_c0~~gnl/TRDRNA2_/TRDRNA2_118116_c0_seq1.p1  ORF type:complete len:220 (+),score=29.01 gnl/TRDRNA2_/TRDRNA2_118116_c0_seq1:56-661(+)
MDGLEETVDFIDGLIEAEVAAGLSYNRILLGGFSQGAGLSLRAGLMRPADKKLAGVLAFSSFMPKPDSFTLSGSEDVPVLMTHGDADMVVNVAWAQRTHKLIKSMGCTATEFKIYPGLAHGINNEILSEMLKFLLQVMPNDPSKQAVKESPAALFVRQSITITRVSTVALISFFVSSGVALGIFRFHLSVSTRQAQPLLAA